MIELLKAAREHIANTSGITSVIVHCNQVDILDQFREIQLQCQHSTSDAIELMAAIDEALERHQQETN